jgi:hypothetical protein
MCGSAELGSGCIAMVRGSNVAGLGGGSGILPIPGDASATVPAIGRGMLPLPRREGAGISVGIPPLSGGASISGPGTGGLLSLMGASAATSAVAKGRSPVDRVGLEDTGGEGEALLSAACADGIAGV